MSEQIAIIGAGIGGLTLAQGLKRLKIPFIIFEKDQTTNFRAQGYRIRLNPQGASVLKSNLTIDLWNLFELTCAIELANRGPPAAIDGLTGQKKLMRGGPPPRPPVDPQTGLGSYSVDRTLLRQILLKDLIPNQDIYIIF